MLVLFRSSHVNAGKNHAKKKMLRTTESDQQRNNNVHSIFTPFQSIFTRNLTQGISQGQENFAQETEGSSEISTKEMARTKEGQGRKFKESEEIAKQRGQRKAHEQERSTSISKKDKDQGQNQRHIENIRKSSQKENFTAKRIMHGKLS